MSVDGSSWSDATKSKAAEELANSFDDLSVKLLWEAFGAIEKELVHANELCSICSATVFQDRLLLSRQSSGDSCFSQNFAEIFYRTTYCWFCRFLCRVVALGSLQNFKRSLKENMPLTVSCGRWEFKLLLSVNTTTPMISYEISVDSSSNNLESRALEDLWDYGEMTCQSLVTQPSMRFRKFLSDTVEQRRH